MLVQPSVMINHLSFFCMSDEQKIYLFKTFLKDNFLFYVHFCLSPAELTPRIVNLGYKWIYFVLLSIKIRETEQIK